MVKTSSQFVCQQCGHTETKWLGRCPNCGEWNSLVETITQKAKTKTRRRAEEKIAGIKLVGIKTGELSRTSTGISELNRVLGGGLVSGQTVLLAGEPGIGKSTLLSQTAELIYPKSKKKTVIYVSGEESAQQLKLRTKRLGLTGDGLLLVESTDTDAIVDFLAQEKPQLVVIDSIQTLTTSDLTGLAGSVGQVRESAARLASVCKRAGVPLFLVGHVTKQGQVAGPAVLMHLVDTVLWFEGDRSRSLRILRTFKNRFGATDEVGIFTMEEEGLVQVKNPSSLFLEGRGRKVPGSVPAAILQGLRPVLVEVQGLVVPSKLAYPKRASQGLDPRRVELLIAVLTRRTGLPLYNFDVFVNVAGGIRVREPAADLAICLAIASAWADKPVASGLAAIGEVGLLGEVRQVTRAKERIAEAKRLGFKQVITQESVRSVKQAVKEYIK